VLAHDRGLAGSVSKVPMAVPMVLRYKELFPSKYLDRNFATKFELLSIS
jgi:hypothetical protein